jgi:PAS domain S-box-containing protein
VSDNDAAAASQSMQERVNVASRLESHASAPIEPSLMSGARPQPAAAAVQPGIDFLARGGECGARLRALDWSRTPLGAPELWPQSLKTIVRVMLDSRYAMWMFWGEALTFFCNDAYLPTVGIKRDWVLGARSDEVWKEIWPDIGPRIEKVLRSGAATWDEALQLFLERSGFPEETYHTFSYSPVYDDTSSIAGMLCVVTEVTERVVGERRLRVLRDLAARTGGANGIEDTARRAIEVLGNNPLDVPFAALYLVEPDRRAASCIAATRALPAGLDRRLALDDAHSPWNLAGVLAHGEILAIDDLVERGIRLPARPWADNIVAARILPVKAAGHALADGFLIAGLSPRRPVDEPYSAFLNLVAGQVANAIGAAQAYDAERRRAEALAELDRAKTTFFSNVSHEFRTPLTLMMGPLETVLQAGDVALAPALRLEVETVQRNSQRLLKLVNTLLDFSRIEAGRMQADFEPTDLARLTSEVAATFRGAIENAGLALEIEAPAQALPVLVDRSMWEKIVLNLLSNAFKYTLAGRIHVSVADTPDSVVLRVADTGVGIPECALPRLFERFYRVPQSAGRSFEGSGIGLALVRELVQLHGGTIGVTSEQGRGSCFTVTLPRNAALAPAEPLRREGGAGAHAPGAAPVPAPAAWVGFAAYGTGATSASRPATAAAGPVSTDPEAGQGAVLLVDDNADMRDYLRRVLGQRFLVRAANDGVDALQQLDSFTPDLILTDVMMPRLDGFGLLQAVRERAATRDIPIVMLSARAGEEARVEGLDAGADDYLIKPFTARELFARVNAHVSLARLRRSAQLAMREGEEARRSAVEALNRQLMRETESLRALFEQAPGFVAVLRGPQHVFELANEVCYRLIGRRDVIGKPLADAMPELLAQPFPALLDRVLQGGEPYVGMGMPVQLKRSADLPLEERYVDFVFQPLQDAAGNRTGVFVQGNDVTERKQMEQALRDSDRRKDEFLAMLAHELRNPLAPIRHATELIARTAPPDPRAQLAIGMVRRQVTQLTRLVDDLLDVSRITQGRIELKTETVDLAQVVDQALESVAGLLRERRHEVVRTAATEPLHIEGDRARLVQCLVNLLANAAKYTDPGGRIEIETRAEGDSALVIVADNGVGIPPTLLPRIFDLFVQSERTLDRAQGGLGIGLSLVKRLVDMHAGTISATSAGVGRGSRFELRLPRCAASCAAAPASEAQREQARRRVLIVDDNVDAADSLAMVLKLEGHSVEQAYEAGEALRIAAAFVPEIVLLDIGLPEVDGFEIARRLRAIVALQDVKLVALTGYGQSEDRARTRAAGFDLHLVKPVDFAALARGFDAMLQT